MKLYYFSQITPKDIGVYKKILFQQKALEKNEVILKKTICKVSQENKHEFYFEAEKIGEEKYGNRFQTLKRRLIDRNKIYINILKKCKIKKIESIYIRYYRSDYFFYIFLKVLKKNKIKIILEIPTYPYDGEVKKKNVSLFIDKYYREKLYKYVDKIVTYSNDDKIWKIQCINISNGIDLDEIRQKNKIIKKNMNIVFTSVSNCSFWHGIDRFLSATRFVMKSYDMLKVA